MKNNRLMACAFALLGIGIGTTFAAKSQTAPQPSVSRQIFLEADLNKDGYIDLDEFHKDVVRAFEALDFNHDGYITVEEIRLIPDKGRVEALLQVLKISDKDHDGRLSFKEVVERRMAYFDAADTNKDGRLSMAEVIAYDAVAMQRLSALKSAAPAKPTAAAKSAAPAPTK